MTVDLAIIVLSQIIDVRTVGEVIMIVFLFGMLAVFMAGLGS